ncbi:MAG: hypothetical protein HRU38_21460 [Saccharospirillaceae bacterium]|nr:hypothetical protein [Pseudomonadales bacterium]NRB81198.1 hypothetical protein [Saccharospirillaceae bacterium]
MSDSHSFETYKFPFTRAIEFKFEENNSIIIYKISTWSPKEELFVDGKLINKKYSFGLVSHFKFELNNTAYEVEFKYIKYFVGEVQCSLIQDNTHIKTINKKRQKGSWKSQAVLIGTAFFIGVLIGFLQDFLGL